MPFLSNLFGSDSSEDSSFDLINAVDGALSLDFTNESYNQEIDEDGSSETSFDSTSFGTDLDFGSILGAMTDSMSDSESDSGGGLLG